MQEFKGKRKVCDVRQYFIKKKEERKAQCKVCGKELAYHGGTSNLLEHLCKIHLLKYSGSGRSSEFSSKEGSIESIQENFCSGTRSKEITEKIVNMILTFTRPIPMVECDGFRVLICTLEPGYVMPRTKA